MSAAIQYFVNNLKVELFYGLRVRGKPNFWQITEGVGLRKREIAWGDSRKNENGNRNFT